MSSTGSWRLGGRRCFTWRGCSPVETGTGPRICCKEALVKLWFAWPKVAKEAPEAYVRRVLARAAARSARRRWWGEHPVDQLPDPPEVADETAAVDEQTRLEAVLALLPARQRAAVVLRYYQDLPERDVAEALGCPVGTARSLTARGVARLRQLLAEAEPVE